MTNQRRWQVVALTGTLGVAAVGGGLAISGALRGKGSAASATAGATPGQAVPSDLALLAGRLEKGDSAALKSLVAILTPKADHPTLKVVSPTEAPDQVRALQALRTGFRAFPPADRALSIAAASLILNRFGVEPAPGPWLDTLRPTHDLFQAGLADPSVDVRTAALNVVGTHWSWLPGRPMTPGEEATLAEWKDTFIPSATRCLGDPEAKSRAAAVVCLGAAPIDSIAAPAVAYVEDPQHGGVRYKALMTFANRPSLLTEDMVLKRLHDKEPGVPELAELILKGRGLTHDQIYLGRQMDDLHPENRAAVIPLIADRTDIDPVIWLLRLSHDPDETVRTKAADALARRGESPQVDQRLREMAASDTSATVRTTAAMIVAKLSHDTTASLPALPPVNTTAGLTIRAN